MLTSEWLKRVLDARTLTRGDATDRHAKIRDNRLALYILAKPSVRSVASKQYLIAFLVIVLLLPGKVVFYNLLAYLPLVF